MAEFFQGEQALTLMGIQCSGGDHNGKIKRIKIKLALTMEQEVLKSSPEWASEAYDYVAKHPDVIRPPYEFEGVSAEFSVDQLFGSKVAKAPQVKMKGFEVYRDGEGEDADIKVVFVADIDFATHLWNWLGQQQGNDFYAKFAQVIEAEKPASEASAQMSLTVN